MMNVVGVNEARVAAPRKSTMLVPRVEGSLDRCWNSPGFSTDVQWFAIPIFDNRNCVAVTTQPLYRLQWQSRATFAFCKCRVIDMDIYKVVVRV